MMMMIMMMKGATRGRASACARPDGTVRRALDRAPLTRSALDVAAFVPAKTTPFATQLTALVSVSQVRSLAIPHRPSSRLLSFTFYPSIIYTILPSFVKIIIIIINYLFILLLFIYYLLFFNYYQYNFFFKLLLLIFFF